MYKVIKTKSSQKGFTLIELIVVLAILVVLAAIALPTFNGLIAESKTAVANANARTVYTAAKAYKAMNPSEITGDTQFTDPQVAKVVNYLGDGFGSDSSDIAVKIEKIVVVGGEIKEVTVTSNGATGKYPVTTP